MTVARVFVCTHHPSESGTALHHSFSLVGKRKDSHLVPVFLHTRVPTDFAKAVQAAFRREPVIINGAFCTIRWSGPAIIGASLALRRPFHVVWHETDVSLRRVAGREAPTRIQAWARRIAWPPVRRMLRSPLARHGAVSQASAAAVRAALGVTDLNVELLYNCIDASPPYDASPARDPHSLRIASAGTDDPRKGQELFCVLLDELRGLGTHATGTWYGRPTTKLERALGSEIELGGYVHDFVGALAGEDLYVSLATDEPCSVAALEAIGAGVATFAREGTGVAELLPEEHRYSSIEDLARRVVAWLSSSEVCRVGFDLSVEAYLGRLGGFLEPGREGEARAGADS